ncbi:sirohydrochlorin chelatase [Allonocardiopsis opalescens]|uniref:sirohydrochlorin chelatase n=1 Tax=Allonocardiopsis opalescens TaxID=1144618 RepID=UPI0011B22BC9|nr:CbiX/SirB N-terminal domain-containing protein [Allonocardiopsis opalescens]
MSSQGNVPHPLPMRNRPLLPGGRHRNPLSTERSSDAPVLVLAGPGPAAEGHPADAIAHLVRADNPDISVDLGYSAGAATALADALARVASADAGPRRGAVVVPLTLAPVPAVERDIRAALERSGLPGTVTAPLGPHPSLAEALHQRLAEAGQARPDRMRMLSVITAADGVVLAVPGGAEAVPPAGVVAVLLAARLGVHVVPAAMDDPGAVRSAAEQLRGSGATRLALAPYAVGPETHLAGLPELARGIGATAAEPLGGHPTLARIATMRYVEAVNAMEAPPAPGS